MSSIDSAWALDWTARDVIHKWRSVTRKKSGILLCYIKHVQKATVVGDVLGAVEGEVVGNVVGEVVGLDEGEWVGSPDGRVVGDVVGLDDGDSHTSKFI